MQSLPHNGKKLTDSVALGDAPAVALELGSRETVGFNHPPGRSATAS